MLIHTKYLLSHEILPFEEFTKGHKKTNKGNFEKSFVYRSYGTLRARMQEKNVLVTLGERERERECVC